MWFGDLGSEIWFKGMGIAPSSIGAPVNGFDSQSKRFKRSCAQG